MNEQKISWKRSDLKWRGKQAFKKNYWSAVLVSLVLAIVMATGGSGAATGSAGNAASPDYGVTTYRLGTDINGVTSYVSHVFRSPLAVLFALLSASAVVAVALIGILFHFFVGNVLEVGGRDFYIENLYSEYKMIPYLLAEYPDMSTKEVFAKSREMMDGQKMDTFILDISFIPWSVLSAITAGIVGLFYVSPYKDATYAELYDTLAAGMPGNGQQVYEDENSGIY